MPSLQVFDRFCVRASVVVLSIVLSGCEELMLEKKDTGVLKIEMSVSDSGLRKGLVILESKLVNTTAKNVSFLPWNTPFDAALNGRFLKVAEIVDSGENTELSYLGFIVKRGQAVAADYLSIGVGEVIENRLDITKNYNFCQNRLYSIRFSGELFGLDHNVIQSYPSVTKFSTGSEFSRCDRD